MAQRREDAELRAEVLKRDKHTCQMCKKKKKKLEIHINKNVNNRYYGLML